MHSDIRKGLLDPELSGLVELLRRAVLAGESPLFADAALETAARRGSRIYGSAKTVEGRVAQDAIFYGSSSFRGKTAEEIVQSVRETRESASRLPAECNPDWEETD